MKKLTAMLMAGIMTLGLVGCGSSTTSETTTETPKATETAVTTETATETTADAAEETSDMDALIAAAKEEGTLTVYGSCEEAYL